MPHPPAMSAEPGASRRVVVLGGSGFVGTAIVASLAQAGFHPVSAQRKPSRIPGGAEQQLCDATDPAALARVLNGAAAAINAVLGDADIMMAATRALHAAARNTLRIVHLSSMAVYGAATGHLDEAAPMRGTGAYAEAKIACEALLAGSSAVILRPGIIYGPGGEQWVARIFRLLRAGRLGDLGENGDGRCNFVHARDVGAAVVAALARPQSAGHAINLAYPVAPRWNTVLAACARAIGAVPVRRIGGRRLDAEARFFGPPLYVVRHAASRVGLHARALPEAITPSLRALFRQDVCLDVHRAGQLLGIAHTPPAEGLAECAAWFLATHGPPHARKRA
jgi:nucleoside-diphosphate-sugar epimerase